MAKHGICLRSNKRNKGKGRYNKPAKKTKRFVGRMCFPSNEWSYDVGKYRTLNQSSRGGMSAPSRKRVIGNRRRARKNLRMSVVSRQSELKSEKEAKKDEVEKMKKEHAKKTRQMQKRFLRDIHELWEKQRLELLALEKSI